MYLQNKYSKWYNSIVDKAKCRTDLIGYFERHHVIPRCLGGSNDKSNLVNLTAQEHFICHWLLTKMTEGKNKSKMIHAAWLMACVKNSFQIRHKISSKKYELLKKSISRETSIKFKGPNNPMFGKRHSNETRKKISDGNIGKVYSEETRLKLKLCNKHTGPNYKLRGKNNAMFKPGVKDKRADIFNQKYGFSGPALVPFICEFCFKEGKGLGNYKRWHGSNCRLNPLNT